MRVGSLLGGTGMVGLRKGMVGILRVDFSRWISRSMGRWSGCSAEKILVS